ncbi:hypothetical protein LTSEJOH_2581 [Salmonella enterica subsp. enterica serovar Johannesburg str. S5-703]|nr:hypothetical protein LTSEJOH_2581 [Salmonella enterica subsp. enterica serovar Johannesburg str. S5-703]
MRLLSLPLPTVLSGLVAVLVGYASSAAIIWQAMQVPPPLSALSGRRRLPLAQHPQRSPAG